ncbi:MAG: Kelch repeat-containing protein [Bacteroidota bacterium]
MKLLYFCFCLLLFTPVLAQNWKGLPAKNHALNRHENAFVQVGDELFLIGGRGEKPVNRYDLQSAKWSETSKPPLEIHHFQAVALDGLVYVIGAFTGGWPYETPVGNILIYDPKEDLWSIGPEIPKDRQRGAAGVSVYQNKIYVTNGIINGHSSGWVNWFDEYDPYSNTWKTLPDSPRARDHFQSVVVDDKLFVAGGRRSGSVPDNGFAGTVKQTDIYNFKTGEWNTFEDIPTPRAGTATAILDNKPVILGGESEKQESAHSEVEQFDLETKTWTSLPEIQFGRHGTQAISLNNSIIIGAGSGNRGGGPELDNFEIFSSEEKVSFEADSILPGKLIVSADNIDFKNSSEVITIENTGGNQAILLSYLQTDTPDIFKIKNKKNLPYIIAPNSSFDIEINASKAGEGNLLIKPAGKSAPLLIKLKRK